MNWFIVAIIFIWFFTPSHSDCQWIVYTVFQISNVTATCDPDLTGCPTNTCFVNATGNYTCNSGFVSLLLTTDCQTWTVVASTDAPRTDKWGANGNFEFNYCLDEQISTYCVTPCYPYFKYFTKYLHVGPIGTVYNGWIDGCFTDPASQESNFQGLCVGNTSALYCPNRGEVLEVKLFWLFVVMICVVFKDVL